MRKILILSLTSLATYAFAATSINSESSSYVAFQQFDRQYSFGFGVTSGQLTNGSNEATNNTQFVNVEVERLFNIGVWMDINAYLLTYYSQVADPAVPTLGVTTGSQAQFGGLNAKVGYAFPLLKDTLMITPYAVLGRNVNLSSYSLAAAPSTANLTQDYFWSVGGGARLEYRLNNVFDFYLDQSAVYNASQAPTTQGLPANNNYAYTTTLGSKFNLYRNFQLGGQLFYTGNYFTQSLVTSSGTALVPQSAIGGMLSVGLTY
ncbi:MAG: hypothetical protein KA049_01095 [Burkholderiales bacterium]|nr:hypothetical protein [Burkholderiales bacterium]MBP9768175.1 hypothetical protein [Burkholderiales bacterium]